ncbi:MAG TPA: hypothetical protein DCE14_01815 [Kosmotogaceae bacterium]|nr:hypothetical protein [Kosmotogaceae bacterium]
MIVNLMQGEPTYLVRFSEKLEEGGLRFGDRTRAEVVRSAVRWLYSKYIDRVHVSTGSVAERYGVSASSVQRIIRLAEKSNHDYLKAASRKIDWYVEFMKLSILQVSMINGNSSIEIRKFLNHLERIIANWRASNRLEVEKFFCRYFYLFDVIPEKDRDSSCSVEVHISPNSCNRYSAFRLERGGNGNGL